MFKIIYVLILVLVFNRFYGNESLLVEIGDYPGDAKHSGVNLPQCGLKRVPKLFPDEPSKEIPYERRCLYEYFKANKSKTTPSSVPSVRVFNGTDAQYDEAPWAVFLEFFYIYKSIRVWEREKCTGVLITFEWVLTAAHCMTGNGVTVFAGSNKRGEGSRINVFKWRGFNYKNSWFVNEDYETDSGEDFDIALIKLDIKFSESVDGDIYRLNPICLPTKKINSDQEMAFFYGYGKININDDVPHILQKGQTLVKLCHDATLFCSNVVRKAKPCGGDSGGPLVQFNSSASNQAVVVGILKGVIPQNTECSERIQAANWVPVSNFIDWILETIANN